MTQFLYYLAKSLEVIGFLVLSIALFQAIFLDGDLVDMKSLGIAVSIFGTGFIIEKYLIKQA